MLSDPRATLSADKPVRQFKRIADHVALRLECQGLCRLKLSYIGHTWRKDYFLKAKVVFHIQTEAPDQYVQSDQEIHGLQIDT